MGQYLLPGAYTGYTGSKTTVRVGLVQWQMRTYKTLDDLFERVEFFVDAVSDYKGDFVLLPRILQCAADGQIQ